MPDLGSDGEDSAWVVRDPGSIPGSGRSPGEGSGSPPQDSCLEDPVDRGAWRATVHGLAKSCPRLMTQHPHFSMPDQGMWPRGGETLKHWTWGAPCSDFHFSSPSDFSLFRIINPDTNATCNEWLVEHI